MTGDNLPKGGGTLTTMGRQRVTYGSRSSSSSSSGVVAASTPNISTTVPGNAILPVGMITGDALAFGDHHMASTVPHSLRQARDNTILDLQAQLKEVFSLCLIDLLVKHCRNTYAAFMFLIFGHRSCVRMRCCVERWKLKRASSVRP